jgi:ribonuclease-3
MPLLEPMADQIVSETNTIDPKSRLQEWTQSQGLGIPRYITALAGGPDHAKIFDVEVHVGGKCLGKGTGPSKHIAQEYAAQNALSAIEMDGTSLTGN